MIWAVIDYFSFNLNKEDNAALSFEMGTESIRRFIGSNILISSIEDFLDSTS